MSPALRDELTALADSSGFAADRFGAYFSVGSIGPISHHLFLPFTPQVENPPGRMLDDAGHPGAVIVASGGLDEYQVADLLDGGAPIDVFGVGTRIGVSSDAPTLDTAYKLVEYDGRPVMKLSEGKVSRPGESERDFRVRLTDAMMVSSSSGRRVRKSITSASIPSSARLSAASSVL